MAAPMKSLQCNENTNDINPDRRVLLGKCRSLVILPSATVRTSMVPHYNGVALSFIAKARFESGEDHNRTSCTPHSKVH